jgi:Zn-dependent peptidase ImmA (M78 family)
MFFMRTPPEEQQARREFRMLPDEDVTSLTADTLYALRDARAFQDSLRELSAGRNPAERQIVRDIQATPDDPEQLGRRVRAYLAINEATQTAWPGAREAMKAWREAVEAAGVFVFKRSFESREISGFCLDDPQFPVIVINNSTPSTRQIFTLFHELGHLLFGVSSISKDDPEFIDRMDPAVRRIEIACNRFAAEVILPAAWTNWTVLDSQSVMSFVSQVARRFCVSREVVLRRLLDRDVVNRSVYAAMTREWNDEVDVRAKGGGSYYATQSAYLGGAFLSLAFSKYRSGSISLAQLAEHTRVRAANLGKLETYMLTHR